MDDGLKASVAAVTHVLSTFPSSELSWESVLREMSQNALVESDGLEDYTRTELFDDQGVPFSLQDSQTVSICNFGSMLMSRLSPPTIPDL